MTNLPPTASPLRRRFILVVLAVVAAALIWRAIDLQLSHGEFLQTQGDARHLRVVTTPPHRGKLLDRNGEPLAISTPVDSVWVDPSKLEPVTTGLESLAEILELDVERLRRVFAERSGREFVYLKRHVGPSVAARVRSLEIPGVNLQREYRRYYPLGEAAAHVVGFTDVDDVGQEGLELALEERLRGQPGAARVLRDRLGRVVENVERIRSPRDGQDVLLSLDGRIQFLAYRSLLLAVKKHSARAGAAVVLDANNGEVLAMVNQPSYNPNVRTDRVGDRIRNRAVTDLFEPGSTIKPFTVAAALESGRFEVGSTIDTRPGFFKVGRHTVRDLRDYGIIDLPTIIRKSSNVGASKIALDLPPRGLWETFSRLGFGATTDSGFPGEAQGTFNHFSQWREIERATLAFGYGVSVTALRLAQSYAVIANGGFLSPVSFERVQSADQWERVLAPETARQVRHMLEAVVGPGGTGLRARVSGYRVGGKTGTVRKSGIGGYTEDRYVALFAGVAPMSNPRVVVVVVIDEPSGEHYYGGRVAAPVFSEIAGGTLRILGAAPDDHSVVTRRIRLGLGSDEILSAARIDMQGLE